MSVSTSCFHSRSIAPVTLPHSSISMAPIFGYMGGVDKMELRKGREAIKAYLNTLAPQVERGGFIPFCDHRCPPDVNETDYLYYLDLKQQMFG